VTVSTDYSSYTAPATTINAGRTASGADYWPGKLDEIRIYNRALSPTELTALAQGKQLNGPQSGAWFKFFEPCPVRS